MSYGITSEGFLAKTFEILVEERIARCRTEFGFVPRGFLKKLIEIVCEPYTELWELGEMSFTGMDPDAATATLQDALAALTGTLRRAATGSTATLTFTGTPTTVVPGGSQAKVAATGDTFETDEDDDATIAALDAWVTATPYVVGDRVTNSSRAYVCITAGTSDVTGPIDTTDDETDGTVHWRYMGEGTGAVDVEAECTETGPIEAPSGEITTIVTPVSGWDSVINLEDADLGRDVETHEELRIRREEELAQAGATTPNAIRAELLNNVDGVISVTVFYNPSDVTDGDGVPPHSVEVLVRGGDDQDIIDALGELCVAAGINTHESGTGGVSGTWTDSEGTGHTINFTRPEEIDIYVDVELEKVADDYPSNGDDLVKAAIVAYGDSLKAGKNVVSSRLIAACFDVTGVDDVTVCDIGLASNPSSNATLAISTRQLAVFDTSRITVVSSNAAP